jgi:ABC transporter substrate binding protein (PQQ-dependent alcohol dehydrogenase system)
MSLPKVLPPWTETPLSRRFLYANRTNVTQPVVCRELIQVREAFPFTGDVRVNRKSCLVRLLLALMVFSQWAVCADAAEIRIAYLRAAETKSRLSLVEIPANDDGLAGAQLAIKDNNTTGKFLNQQFSLEDTESQQGDDFVVAARTLAERGIELIIADLPADALLRAADGRPNLLFFNVGAADDRLREEDCRSNVIHVAPTRSMLADGLAQYLVWKQWRRWFLLVGSHDNDKLYGDALRRAGKRFGARLVQEKVFEDTGGARRTDSGIAQVQRQIPVLTQGAPAYDVLVAGDESEVFASYLPYRTWDPRPVAGSAGLVPTTWDPSHDQWGAVQMQSRFSKMFGRRMTARDMQAWTAVRMIGEAASRTGSSVPRTLLAFLKGPDFAIAAFKGQRLTLREWNLQLRQPILLTDGRMVISVSPQEGFLHQLSELDTLGVDRPETKCRLN